MVIYDERIDNCCKLKDIFCGSQFWIDCGDRLCIKSREQKFIDGKNCYICVDLEDGMLFYIDEDKKIIPADANIKINGLK